MKSYRKELWFDTSSRRQYINITPQVEDCLRESGVKEGLVLCNAMHITASVFINDDESGLHNDFEVWLEKLAPEKPYSQYQHNGFENNADAHLKRSVMGREVVVAVSDGKRFYLIRREFLVSRQSLFNDDIHWQTKCILAVKVNINSAVTFFCRGQPGNYTH